ncbi:MAG TPA: excinuclease ABC subunit A, partial [Chthoniobacterales bacterium]
MPVESQSLAAITKQIETAAKRGAVKVLAPLVKARKGWHTDVARWAERQGFDTLFIDGQLVPISQFRRLARFKEHTISVVVGVIDSKRIAKAREFAQRALDIGRGTAHLLDSKNNLTVMSTEMSCPNCGRAFEELDPRLFSFNSPHGACEECGGFGEIWDQEFQTAAEETSDSVLENELRAERESEWIEATDARECPACNGSRINDVARHVRVQGMTIDQFTNLSASEAAEKIDKLKFAGTQETIAADLIPEIRQRLRFMENVGLGYLALGRSAKTLSGGESQRIRLAAQLGSNLRGVLYVLDEPTIGLHPRDNLRLLDTLEALREKGNSLVIVEHDDETMRRADHIVDLGPRAGIHGGEVVFNGSFEEFLGGSRSPSAMVSSIAKRSNRSRKAASDLASSAERPIHHSLTREYLTGQRSIKIGASRRSLRSVENWIEIHGARANNLKNVDVRFPVGRLSVITGISGSGKSTLMHDVLLPAVIEDLENKKRRGNGDLFKLVSGTEEIEAVYEVDQSPIGKTSRSTPGTYIKVFDEMRNLYAQLPVSRVRGYS